MDLEALKSTTFFGVFEQFVLGEGNQSGNTVQDRKFKISVLQDMDSIKMAKSWLSYTGDFGISEQVWRGTYISPFSILPNIFWYYFAHSVEVVVHVLKLTVAAAADVMVF